MAKTLIVRSNIKEYAKVDNTQMRVAGDFADRLEKKVIQLIQEACKRAKEEGRNTVMGRHV